MFGKVPLCQVTEKLFEKLMMRFIWLLLLHKENECCRTDHLIFRVHGIPAAKQKSKDPQQLSPDRSKVAKVSPEEPS